MTAPQDEVTQNPAGDRLLDVVVVGGSQAGLAMAWHLQRQGLDFVVLEAGPELGHVWRSRWDSLKLFIPSQYDALPGMAFPAPADTYPTKDPVADYLQAYATAFNLPIRVNSRSGAVMRSAGGRCIGWDLEPRETAGASVTGHKQQASHRSVDQQDHQL